MLRKLYQTTPRDYAVCLHSECPRAKDCLRYTGYQMTLKEERKEILILNPSHCTANESCPHFRSNKLVHYARGFTNFQRHIMPDKYNIFMGILIEHFCRNSYFLRRRGELALPPSEQEIVLKALKRAGVTETLQFDMYIDAPNWYE